MKTKYNKKSQKQKNRRLGTATVELAITLPILLLFLLGTIDAGQFANAYQTVSNASREGARVAVSAETTNVATVRQSVMDYLAAAFPGASRVELDAAVKTTVASATGEALDAGELAMIAPGSPVRVDVSLEFDAVRYIPGLDQLDDRFVQVSTIMRRE